jgi:predicted O-linked N-acetylglucosamine transferase (SPINDLY family)
MMATIAEIFSLALHHHRAGRLPEAEALYRQILQSQPGHPDALHLLGLIAHHVGRHEAAVDLMSKAIAINPAVPEYHNNIGEAYRAQGKRKEAMDCYRRALELRPDYQDSHHNMGVVFHEQGDLQEAVACYQRVLSLNPSSAGAFNGLGVTLAAQGKLDEGIGYLRQAVALMPGSAQACNNLGAALRSQGKLDEALAYLKQAVALQPAFAEAYNNLGLVLGGQGKTEEAAAHYRQALALRPAYAEAHVNLGGALKEQGQLEEAETCYRQALAIQPSDGVKIKLATMLPVVLSSVEEVATIRKKFEDNLDALLKEDLTLKDPVLEVGQTNFYLAYQGYNDRDLQMKVARLYERACPSLLYTAPHCASPAGERAAGKIKIGFVSRFLKNHSIGKMTHGLIAKLSRTQCEVTTFLIPPVKQDEIAESIRRQTDNSVILPWNLQAARERIAEERLDVLVYPDIGMEPVTYFLAFARLASVQCVLPGHPVTTGIRNMDYFISTETSEPENGGQHYSERLIRLKSHAFAYYHKPAIPPLLKSRLGLGLDEGEHIYLCPQALFKFHPDFDAVLSAILDADPRGRLVLVNGWNVPSWTDMLLQRFARTMPRHGGRITVLPPQTGSDFINLIAVADVMLDTLHFGGGYTTNLEAFAVGTPVVTWPGEFQRGRFTYVHYRQMGIKECVAWTKRKYVDIAVRLGTDPAFREQVKAKILANNRVLYENLDVVLEFERFCLRAIKQARSPKKGRA